MRIIAVIPARWESSRFPGKPMTMIKGVPMIERVYREAVNGAVFSSVYVATDHPIIYDHIQSIGGNAILTGEQDNGTVRVAEAIGHIPEDFDVVVNLQGDQPVIPPGVLDVLIETFQQPGSYIATLAKHSQEETAYSDPNLVKVTIREDATAGEFSRHALPGSSANDYFYHIGIYAFRKGVIEKLVGLPPSPDEMSERLEQLRWMYHGYPVHIAISPFDVQAVDVPEDIDKINRLLDEY